MCVSVCLSASVCACVCVCTRVCGCVCVLEIHIAKPILYYFSAYIHSSYNGISSLPPLELWRFPSLKALFLQGMQVLEIVSEQIYSYFSV